MTVELLRTFGGECSDSVWEIRCPRWLYHHRQSGRGDMKSDSEAEESQLQNSDNLVLGELGAKLIRQVLRVSLAIQTYALKGGQI